jgi:hypothetical protein
MDLKYNSVESNLFIEGGSKEAPFFIGLRSEVHEGEIEKKECAFDSRYPSKVRFFKNPLYQSCELLTQIISSLSTAGIK